MRLKNTLLFGVFILLGCFFLKPVSINGQNDKIIYPHKAFWLKSEVTQIFDNNWGVGIDYFFRSSNTLGQGSIFDRWHRHSYRPWVYYQFDKNLRASISPLSYFTTQDYIGKESDLSKTPYYELRTTFQLIHHHKMMGERLTHTFKHMLEVRYRNIFEDEGYVFTRYRMRYRLRYLLNRDYYAEQGMMYSYISNEVMTSFGKNVVYNMFSQNRIQLAFGYRFHRSSRIEMRYMNRFRSRGSGYEYDRTHALMVGVFVDQLSSLFGKDIRPVKFYD